MRLSRYIFLVIICFLSSKFAISKDYGEKIENRLDGKVKRGWNEQFQAENMLERHKQLARLFTALHLHAQFTDDNLAPDDFLAGIWNLKNGSVLDGLIQLNPDGIIQELESIMPNVSRIVTSDDTILFRLWWFFERFDVISVAYDGWKKFLSLTIPDKPWNIDSDELKYFKRYLSENQAYKAERLLSKIADPPRADDENLTLFDFQLYDCNMVLQDTVSYIEPFLKIEQNKLEQFVEYMGLIDPICMNSQELLEFSTFLSTSKDYFSNIASSSFNISEMKYIKSEDEVWPTLQNTYQLVSDSKMRLDQNVDYDLSNLSEDLQNSNWLKEVLNETEIARKLNLPGSLLKKLNDEFNQFSANARSLNYEFTKIFILVSKLHKVNTSFVSESTMTANCFNISSCWASFDPWPTDFHQFPGELIKLKEDLKKIAKTISEFERKDYLIKTFKEHMNDIRKRLEFWDRSEARRILRHDASLFWELVLEMSSRRTISLLTKAEHIDNWRKEVPLLFKDDCKSAFDFDTSQLKLMQNVSETYLEIQKRDLVSKFKKLMESIPTMEKLRNDLRETVESMKKENGLLPKNVTQLKIKNRENLLKFSSAVHYLEQIRNIDKLDAELGIIIEKGDEVAKAVETTDALRYKRELEKIWGDWPKVKVDLKRFRGSINKMMLQIGDIPEKSLEKIGQQYFWLSAVRLQGSFDLKKYRESLRLLDKNPAPELEEALRKLEVPMSMDWDLVHTNFGKMPEVMRELQKDFDCFFDEKKCPKEDRSMIMMERYRKNQEKFYKIDLRKQLLSLAYGWSMAIVPPGLLLLTWLWIVGKFNKHYFGKEDDYETESDTDDSDSDWDDGYTSTDSNESNTAYNGY